MNSNALIFLGGPQESFPVEPKGPPLSTDYLEGRLVEVLSVLEIDELEVIAKIKEVIVNCFNHSSASTETRPMRISPKYKVIVFKQDETVELYLYPTKNQCLSSDPSRQKGRSKSFREAYKIEMDLQSNSVVVIGDVPEKVALLKSTLIDTLGYPERETFFNHEVELLNSLKHTSLFSRLYASTIYNGKKRGSPCRKGIMFQKYYPNGDYEDLLSGKTKAQPLSTSKIKRFYIKGLLEALMELEAAKICHSDLTPANIMLDDDLNPVIIDLEFALSLNELNPFNQGELIDKYLGRGTPELMAPEKICALFKGQKISDADLKGNVWSIGCIIHYLMKGFWPEVVQKIGVYFAEAQHRKKIQPHQRKALLNQQEEIRQAFEKMEALSDGSPKNAGMKHLLKMMLHPNPKKRFSPEDALAYFNTI